MLQRIVLYGTTRVHPMMPELVKAVLEEELPDHVGIELDAERATLRTCELQARINSMRKQYPDADTHTLRWYLNMQRMTYEAARQHCDEHSTPERKIGLLLTDPYFRNASITQEFVRESEQRLLRRPLEEVMEWSRQGFTPRAPPELVDEYVMRDAAAEAMVRPLDGKVVLFAGVARTHGDYGNDRKGSHISNLYERFGNISADRHLLVDVEVKLL